MNRSIVPKSLAAPMMALRFPSLRFLDAPGAAQTASVMRTLIQRAGGTYQEGAGKPAGPLRAPLGQLQGSAIAMPQVHRGGALTQKMARAAVTRWAHGGLRRILCQAPSWSLRHGLGASVPAPASPMRETHAASQPPKPRQPAPQTEIPVPTCGRNGLAPEDKNGIAGRFLSERRFLRFALINLSRLLNRLQRS